MIDPLVEQVKALIIRIFSNTTKTPTETLADLEAIQEELEARIDTLRLSKWPGD